MCFGCFKNRLTFHNNIRVNKLTTDNLNCLNCVDLNLKISTCKNREHSVKWILQFKEHQGSILY